MLRVMMNNPSGYDLKFDGPSVYRIRVSGRLSASWSDRLGGMTITVFSADTGPCVTSLVGELSDQADLAGVFNTLYGLHLPVLSVECLNALP
jgi:hypothetical protein